MVAIIIKIWSAITYYIHDRINRMRINNPDILNIYPIYSQEYLLNSNNIVWYPDIRVDIDKRIYYSILLAYYLLIPLTINENKQPIYTYNHIINIAKEVNNGCVSKINIPVPLNIGYVDIPIIAYNERMTYISKYILYSQLRNIRENRGKYLMVTLDNEDITDIYNRLGHYYEIFINDSFANRKKYLRKILFLELNKTDVKDIRDYKLILTDRNLSEKEINV